MTGKRSTRREVGGGGPARHHVARELPQGESGLGCDVKDRVRGGLRGCAEARGAVGSPCSCRGIVTGSEFYLGGPVGREAHPSGEAAVPLMTKIPLPWLDGNAGRRAIAKPDAGTTTDQIVYYYYQPGQPQIFLSHSNLIPEGHGDTVLTNSQMYELGTGLDAGEESL